MTRITLSTGESLKELLCRSGNLISFNSGIWVIESGSLQKRSLRVNTNPTVNSIMDDYSIVNIYTKGDYFMGDSDLVIDYFALESTTIGQVPLDKIDSVKVLFQLASLEEYVHYATYNHREDATNNRLSNLLGWLGRKMNTTIDGVMALLSQEEIGRMVGLNRSTVNRKIKAVTQCRSDNNDSSK